VAICVLGGGGYGANEIDGTRRVPVFLFGGHDEWFKATFGRTFEESLKLVASEKRAAWAECFDSTIIGDAADRRTYLAGLALIDDPEKRKQWRDRWHDERRSSLNDIGTAARKRATALRATVTP
jgi:hypothetical protein